MDGIRWYRGYISIHLMLRFISHYKLLRIRLLHFNTSHVTVYLFSAWLILLSNAFQYISCYGLSEAVVINAVRQCNFNTSHVTVYPHPSRSSQGRISISIHLMLRFILSRTSVAGNVSSFQYISCYGLSSTTDLSSSGSREFQYISCYGLSLTLSTFPVQPHLFQYISCYGLSKETEKSNTTDRQFQYISCYGLSCSCCNLAFVLHYFNTSHVTVYHFRIHRY